jgi:hypothetical protein
MNEGLSVLVGMTIAYAASFLGLVIAWVSYKRRRKTLSPRTKRDLDA